jgi:hypothetical protein
MAAIKSGLGKGTHTGITNTINAIVVTVEAVELRLHVELQQTPTDAMKSTLHKTNAVRGTSVTGWMPPARVNKVT